MIQKGQIKVWKDYREDQVVRGLWGKHCNEQLRVLGMSSEEKIRGYMIAVFRYLQGSPRNIGINLLSKVPEGRSRCLLKRYPMWN